MKTILIGLGNPLLTDDAIGIRVARSLSEDDFSNIDIEEASVGGMELVEMLMGYERAVIVDSIITGKKDVGTISRITPEDFKETRNVSNLHNVGFLQALKIWSAAGDDMIPHDIVIYAIEVEDVHTFSETMTPKVEQTLPRVIQLVRKELLS